MITRSVEVSLLFLLFSDCAPSDRRVQFGFHHGLETESQCLTIACTEFLACSETLKLSKFTSGSLDEKMLHAHAETYLYA